MFKDVQNNRASVIKYLVLDNLIPLLDGPNAAYGGYIQRHKTKLETRPAAVSLASTASAPFSPLSPMSSTPVMASPPSAVSLSSMETGQSVSGVTKVSRKKKSSAKSAVRSSPTPDTPGTPDTQVTTQSTNATAAVADDYSWFDVPFIVGAHIRKSAVSWYQGFDSAKLTEDKVTFTQKIVGEMMSLVQHQLTVDSLDGFLQTLKKYLEVAQADAAKLRKPYSAANGGELDAILRIYIAAVQWFETTAVQEIMPVVIKIDNDLAAKSALSIENDINLLIKKFASDMFRVALAIKLDVLREAEKTKSTYERQLVDKPGEVLTSKIFAQIKLCAATQEIAPPLQLEQLKNLVGALIKEVREQQNIVDAGMFATPNVFLAELDDLLQEYETQIAALETPRAQTSSALQVA